MLSLVCTAANETLASLMAWRPETLHAGIHNLLDGSADQSRVWTQKFFEVIKYIAVSYHGHLSYAVVANKKFWEDLPADVRPNLEKAMTESTDYFNSIAKKENDEALEDIKKTGKTQVYFLTPEERKSWVQAVLPVHKEMEKRVGKETIDARYKVVDFKPDA